MEKEYLYSFHWSCGRQGDLNGLFVATEKNIEEAIGSYLYFGEVLGKHSEIYGTFDRQDVKKIDISPEAVKEVSKHLGDTWSGFNPLYYVKCEECEETAEYCGCDHKEEDNG